MPEDVRRGTVEVYRFLNILEHSRKDHLGQRFLATENADGWSAVDIRVFDPNGKRSKTLALVMYRHIRGEPSAAGEFSVMTFDDERTWPKYKP